MDKESPVGFNFHCSLVVIRTNFGTNRCHRSGQVQVNLSPILSPHLMSTGIKVAVLFKYLRSKSTNVR